MVIGRPSRPLGFVARGRESPRHRRRRLHRLAPLPSSSSTTARRSGRSTTSPPARSRTSSHLTERPGFHLVVESVLSPSVVSELVHKCDVVYHLAAAVGVRLIVEQPVHTMVTNVQGTEIVLDYCTQFGKRVLIASSSEVYGDHREERPLSEDDRRVYGPVTERRWLYADSKAMDEFLALALPPGARARLRHRALLQHRRPAPAGPVRDGHPPLRRARARRRAARGPRRRDPDAVVLPRPGHDPRRPRADGARSTSRARSSTSARARIACGSSTLPTACSS